MPYKTRTLWITGLSKVSIVTESLELLIAVCEETLSYSAKNV